VNESVTRLPSESTVLAACTRDPDPRTVAALQEQYRRLGGTLVIAGEEPLLFGAAYGGSGPATDAELLDALRRPELARELRGRFVLAGGGRLITSADVRHSLKVVEHDGERTWATKGTAAVALSGRRLELNRDAVAEFVLFDFVLCEEELLQGVALVEEASVVDVGGSTYSWWPRAERLSPARPSTPADLRAALTKSLVPVVADPRIRLALTAGRDSTLVADCARVAGGHLRTFTIGNPRWPDPVGAAAVAGHLGWEHAVVDAPRARRASFAEAVRWTPWTEGLVLARDLVGPPLDWSNDPDVWLSGSGGEVGRAMYWRHAAPDHVEPGVELRNASAALVEHPRLRDRYLAMVDGFGVPGRADGASRLDLLYALGRMRSWLDRGRPVEGVSGTVAPFLDPAVLLTLLDLPLHARHDGSAFDDALRLGQPDLHELAVAVVRERMQRRHLVQRVRDRFRPPVRGELQRLFAVLREAEPWLEPVKSALGPRWWEHAHATAATDTRSSLSLWNAVSVAALVAHIEGDV
jgi:hypothetical protein